MEKDFTDAFLPHFSKSILMKRLNVSSDTAIRIQDQIRSFQRDGKIAKKTLDPKPEDYDTVVAAIQAAGSGYGSRQVAIDAHCRSTGPVESCAIQAPSPKRWLQLRRALKANRVESCLKQVSTL